MYPQALGTRSSKCVEFKKYALHLSKSGFYPHKRNIKQVRRIKIIAMSEQIPLLMSSQPDNNRNQAFDYTNFWRTTALRKPASHTKLCNQQDAPLHLLKMQCRSSQESHRQPFTKAAGLYITAQTFSQSVDINYWISQKWCQSPG